MLNLNLLNGSNGGTPDGTYKVASIAFSKAVSIDNTSSARSNIIVKHPNDTNKVVIIHTATGTIIDFYTYDYITKEVVKLTKSGVTVSLTSVSEYPEAVVIGTTIYFYNKCSSGANNVYSFTISGTTITQGTILNIVTQVSIVENHYTKMTTDGTDLYFMVHNLVTKEFWKYDISATTWSSLSTVNTNFTNNPNGVSIFGRGTAKIYAVGGVTTSHGVSILEEYDIAGDTWTVIGSFTALTSGYIYGIICDFDDPLSPVYYSEGTSLYELNTSTAELTFIGGGAGTANFPVASFSYGSGQYYMTGYFKNSATKNMLITSSENGVFLDISDFINGTQFELLGAGTYVGADVEDTYAQIDDTYNRIRQSIQIDGGDWIQILTYSAPVGQQNFRIKFSTSLRIRNNILQSHSGSNTIFCNAHYYEE